MNDKVNFTQYKVFQSHFRASRISLNIPRFNFTLELMVHFQVVGLSYLSNATLKYVDIGHIFWTHSGQTTQTTNYSGYFFRLLHHVYIVYYLTFPFMFLRVCISSITALINTF